MGERILLREFYSGATPVKTTFLTEYEQLDVRKNNTMYLNGIFQRANVLNQNGRIYSRDILEREDKKFQEKIQYNLSTGECDHPDTAVLTLRNISHLIVETWWEDDALWGKLRILNTEAGRYLKDLVNERIPLAISSRGMGSVREASGKTFVNDDFDLICYDCVADPSTPGAFLNLVAESKHSNFSNNQNFQGKEYSISSILNEILKK